MPFRDGVRLEEHGSDGDDATYHELDAAAVHRRTPRDANVEGTIGDESSVHMSDTLSRHASSHSPETPYTAHPTECNTGW